MRLQEAAIGLACQHLDGVISHVAFFLLNCSLLIPRLTYLLRSAPCFEQAEALARLDAVVRSSFESTVNVALDHRS